MVKVLEVCHLQYLYETRLQEIALASAWKLFCHFFCVYLLI